MIIEPVFREIVFGSEEYRRARELRHEVLRRPLGRNLYDEDLSAEVGQLHFGLFEGEALVACVVAVPIAEGKVKLRQMAVSREMQGRGLGSRMLERVEEELVKRGYGEAWLHARACATGFYRRLGFEISGGEFLEVGIPHIEMWKRLKSKEG